MGIEKEGKIAPTGGRTVERAAIAFSPGLILIGRITARDDPWLEVEFTRRQRHTLAVGATIQVNLDSPVERTTLEHRATVIERRDRGRARRYRLQLDCVPLETPHPIRPGSAPASSHSVSIELRFGEAGHAAELMGWAARGVQLRVTQHVEAALSAADALELVFRTPGASTDDRMIGWIDQRVLEGDHVTYGFRIDERLNDDVARQRERLRRFVEAERTKNASTH